MLGVFTMHEPATVPEAAGLLARYGPDAVVYAGGTELLILMREGLVHYPHLVNIKTIPGLDRIGLEDHAAADAWPWTDVPGECRTLTIGPLATHHQLSRSPVIRTHAGLLAEVEQQVANIRVRVAGTIGGNLCFAEPHSDPATLLVAWGAALELSSPTGLREIPADEFFVGMLETARHPDEILTAIRLPVPVDSSCFGGAYEKFSLHERPTVTVAAFLVRRDGTIDRARLAVGSVGPVPLCAGEAEESLRHLRPTVAAFKQAARLAALAVDPVDDLYGSAGYKRHLVSVLTARALAAAANNAGFGMSDE